MHKKKSISECGIQGHICSSLSVRVCACQMTLNHLEWHDQCSLGSDDEGDFQFDQLCNYADPCQLFQLYEIDENIGSISHGPQHPCCDDSLQTSDDDDGLQFLSTSPVIHHSRCSDEPPGPLVCNDSPLLRMEALSDLQIQSMFATSRLFSMNSLDSRQGGGTVSLRKRNDPAKRREHTGTLRIPATIHEEPRAESAAKKPRRGTLRIHATIHEEPRAESAAKKPRRGTLRIPATIHEELRLEKALQLAAKKPRGGCCTDTPDANVQQKSSPCKVDCSSSSSPVNAQPPYPASVERRMSLRPPKPRMHDSSMLWNEESSHVDDSVCHDDKDEEEYDPCLHRASRSSMFAGVYDGQQPRKSSKRFRDLPVRVQLCLDESVKVKVRACVCVSHVFQVHGEHLVRIVLCICAASVMFPFWSRLIKLTSIRPEYGLGVQS